MQDIYFHLCMILIFPFFFLINKEKDICGLSKIIDFSLLETSNITLLNNLTDNLSSDIILDENNIISKNLDKNDLDEVYITKNELENINDNESIYNKELDIDEELLKPLLKTISIELRSMSNLLRAEYNSIFSKPIIDILEDCMNKKIFTNDILKLMIKAKELLYIEEKRISNTPLLKGKTSLHFDGKTSTNQIKNQVSSLSFYLQSNISILKKTLLIYNDQHEIFLNREMILGNIIKLLNELNLLIPDIERISRNESFIDFSSINESLSKVVNNYDSILKKIQKFKSSEYYMVSSKSISFYLQVILCRLKQKLENLFIFDELILNFNSRFKICK